MKAVKLNERKLRRLIREMMEEETSGGLETSLQELHSLLDDLITCAVRVERFLIDPKKTAGFPEGWLTREMPARSTEEFVDSLEDWQASISKTDLV